MTRIQGDSLPFPLKPEQREFVSYWAGTFYRFPEFTALFSPIRFAVCGSGFKEAYGYVEGISSPITGGYDDKLFEQLIQVSTPSKVGKGSSLVIDESCWKAKEITNFVPSAELFQEVGLGLSELKEEMGLEEDLSVRFHKLTLYEEGDFFLPHMDNPRSNGQTMTLVVEVPATFFDRNRFGGRLVVDGMVIEKSNDCQHILFFHDVEHEVTKLRFGTRLALIFDVIRESASCSIPVRTISSPRNDFLRGLEEIYKRGHMRVGFLANYIGFTPPSQEKGNISPQVLKGIDLVLYEAMCTVSARVDILEVYEEEETICLAKVMSFDSIKGQFPFFRAPTSDDGPIHTPKSSQASTFDDYDEIEPSLEDHPSIFSSRFKLGDVVFLASDGKCRAKHAPNNEARFGGDSFETCTIYGGLAVIATFAAGMGPKSARTTLP